MSVFGLFVFSLFIWKVFKITCWTGGPAIFPDVTLRQKNTHSSLRFMVGAHFWLTIIGRRLFCWSQFRVPKKFDPCISLCYLCSSLDIAETWRGLDPRLFQTGRKDTTSCWSERYRSLSAWATSGTRNAVVFDSFHLLDMLFSVKYQLNQKKKNK